MEWKVQRPPATSGEINKDDRDGRDVAMGPRPLSNHHHHHRQQHHHHHQDCVTASTLRTTGQMQAPPPTGSAPSGPRGIVSAHISGLLRLPRSTRYTSSCCFRLRRPLLNVSDNTCTGLKVATRRSFKPRARFFFFFFPLCSATR